MFIICSASTSYELALNCCGPAVGVGVTMTLPMDIRLASEEAKFGFVFARRGLVPEAASSWFLPRIVGISKALEWTFSGRVFSAEEAKEGGLVRSVHPADELLDEANKIAQEIVENTAAVSVAMTRQMLWKLLGADHPMEAHMVDSRAIYEMVAITLQTVPPISLHTVPVISLQTVPLSIMNNIVLALLKKQYQHGRKQKKHYGYQTSITTQTKRI